MSNPGDGYNIFFILKKGYFIYIKESDPILLGIGRAYPTARAPPQHHANYGVRRFRNMVLKGTRIPLLAHFHGIMITKGHGN